MAFFRNCDPDDPLCIDECRLQKFEYLRWVRLLPSGDEDVLSYCASIGARLGKSEGYVSRRIDAFSMLLELSKVLKNVAFRHHAFDGYRAGIVGS
ncbi:hypothetical protein FRC0016_01585 [Corynebacterium diphtheriae]|nr:hypothetical protein FRC0016_01585 [Corynebacterium diphtheriae]